MRPRPLLKEEAMNRWGWCSLAAALVQVGLAPAQEPQVIVQPANVTMCICEPMTEMGCCINDRGRFWGSVDYLLWWITDGPSSVPLVTTTTAGQNVADEPGRIGGPGTVVLFGGDSMDYGTFSGIRATVGGWLGGDSVVGIEVGGFALEQRSVGFNAASNAAGSPPLAIPYRGPAGEEALNISNFAANALYQGGIDISSASRLWGAEVNAVGLMVDNGSSSWTLLAGFRYADLDEDLILSVASHFNRTRAGNPNLPADEPQSYRIAFTDSFSTRNQFYGGQVGSRFRATRGRLLVDFVTKVALGSTHQTVDINGNTNIVRENVTNDDVITATTPLVRSQGLFAQSTNTGRRSQDVFTVIPEVGVKVGFAVAPGIFASVGYDAMYWSNVVRAGGQIDRTINGVRPEPPTFTSVIPPTATTGQPAPLFNDSSLWAHGVSFGLELRY